MGETGGIDLARHDGKRRIRNVRDPKAISAGAAIGIAPSKGDRLGLTGKRSDQQRPHRISNLDHPECSIVANESVASFNHHTCSPADPAHLNMTKSKGGVGVGDVYDLEFTLLVDKVGIIPDGGHINRVALGVERGRKANILLILHALGMSLDARSGSNRSLNDE
jgi:hypothetical protein